MTSSGLPVATKLLIGGFVGSGTLHLVRPQTYLPLMPDFVPAHREVILASGVVELLCAAGMAAPATRRAAGWASVALLLAVFPGNVKMATDSNRTTSSSRASTAWKAISWGRLPLQIPMIRAALGAARA